jgi:PIN domain nuclease of toxin-antitoxin system
MRVLLDTHVLLWWLADDQRLATAHRELIADSGNDVLVSAVTVAETAIKASLGKLDAPVMDASFLEGQGFGLLDLTAAHAVALRELPWHHRDPFDRMLVAQALTEGIPLLTADRNVARYGISVH